MLVRTDDSDAFGQPELLRINFVIPEGQTCSKAILRMTGGVELTFLEPESPISVNLNSQQSAILKDNVNCDLILYDGEGKQLTIPCVAEFKTRESADKK